MGPYGLHRLNWLCSQMSFRQALQCLPLRGIVLGH